MPQSLESFLDEYSEAVVSGAKLLDQLSPGWANHIDENKLDMNCMINCIIGQLAILPELIFDTDIDGMYMPKLMTKLDLAMSTQYGFNPFGFDLPFGFDEDEIAKEAKSVWMEEINKRK